MPGPTMPSQVVLISGETVPWFQAKPGFSVTYRELQLGVPASAVFSIIVITGRFDESMLDWQYSTSKTGQIRANHRQTRTKRKNITANRARKLPSLIRAMK